MITLVTGVELLPEIQKMCSRDEDIYFAVSYWSGGAAERIKGFTKGQLHVVLDIHSGGTNPRDLRVLMEWLGDRVKIHPDLHAKVYASETLALLGSANATSPGLQMRETGRVEAVLRIESPDAKEVFEFAKQQYEAGRPATKEDLDTCERLFSRVPVSQAEAGPVRRLGLVDALYEQPELYARLPLIVTDEEVIDKDRNEGWKQSERDLAGFGWTRKFSPDLWDDFKFDMDERYQQRTSLALHVGETGEVFAGLVRPIMGKPRGWTFARRVDWSEVLGLKYTGCEAKRLVTGQNEVRQNRLNRIRDAIGRLATPDPQYREVDDLINLLRATEEVLIS